MFNGAVFKNRALLSVCEGQSIACMFGGVHGAGLLGQQLYWCYPFPMLEASFGDKSYPIEAPSNPLFFFQYKSFIVPKDTPNRIKIQDLVSGTGNLGLLISLLHCSLFRHIDTI